MSAQKLVRSRRLVLSFVCAVSVVVTIGFAAAAAANPLVPSSDPFYSYSGSLAAVAPGTILKTRSVPVVELGLAPLTATQVLYRTTGELGQPTATVATVFRALLPSSKLISYQMAYDGLGPQCDPSYSLQGGMPTEDTNPDEEQVILAQLAAGYNIVTADYEGTNLDFVSGQESGYGTLDGIRAAEKVLSLPSSAPVGMDGYSGGSIATDWAAELAPSYAPGLNLVGAAFGGIPVDLAHNLPYVNGSPTWGGVLPAALIGIARGNNIDLAKYLSPFGAKIIKTVTNECLASSLGQFPKLTYQQLLKPQYQNIYAVPVFDRVLNHLEMGTAGTPRMPLYMVVGNVDGKGDDVMIAADDEALAHEYCSRGVSVQFAQFYHDDHGTAAVAFIPLAAAFLEGVMNGMKPANGCASIGVGNSLTPLAVPTAANVKWKLAVTPGRVRGGRRIRFTFTLRETAAGVTTAISGATIRFAKHTARTTGLGKATIVAVLRGPRGSVYRVRAVVSGKQVATTTVTVRR